ncbi:MAG: MotA/TolQ/ExbB proton channel family protein [Halobacteriota archaeon]
MELLSELMKILLAVSNSLLYPVLILLIVLVALCFAYTGGLLSEYSKRSSNLEEKINGGHLSGFYKKLNELLAGHHSDEEIITREVERLLQAEEVGIMKKLEKPRMLIRVGPILGLMGTLIPLGPALLGLSAGNIEQLANNLVIAFTSTVVGLLIGAVSMVVATVRQRWYMEDMNDMEYVAEKLIKTTRFHKINTEERK